MRWCVLGGEEDDPTLLAPDGDALQEPQHDEENGRRRTERGVGGQQPDQRADHPHHRQRRGEGLLAAQAVAEVAEHGAAHRAGHEGHTEGRERQEGRDQVLLGGEEQMREHQRRGRPVDEEVVPLDARAQQRRDGDPGVAAVERHGGTSVRMDDSERPPRAPRMVKPWTATAAGRPEHR